MSTLAAEPPPRPQPLSLPQLAGPPTRHPRDVAPALVEPQAGPWPPGPLAPRPARRPWQSIPLPLLTSRGPGPLLQSARLHSTLQFAEHWWGFRTQHTSLAGLPRAMRLNEEGQGAGRVEEPPPRASPAFPGPSSRTDTGSLINIWIMCCQRPCGLRSVSSYIPEQGARPPKRNRPLSQQPARHHPRLPAPGPAP